MPNTPPFVIYQRPCEAAVVWAVSKLDLAGFQAVRTFDLQAARAAHLDCPCPHHGTVQCNCQMVVLLVYQANSAPATMVIHGNDQSSWFYLINTIQQPIRPELEKNIQEVLSLEIDTTA